MDLEKTGGPAFPNPQASFDHTGAHDAYMGMTLRDRIAITAMHALMSSMVEFPDENWRDDLAADSYRMADAMLRAKGPT